MGDAHRVIEERRTRDGGTEWVVFDGCPCLAPVVGRYPTREHAEAVRDNVPRPVIAQRATT